MSSIEQLFADHRKFLWSLSYRMTGSAADADDVVQDTFVRAMEHPPRRMEDPLRPWLVKVALNLSRDVLRRRKRREYVGPWLPSPIETTDEPPSHEPAIDGVRALEGRYDLLESVSFAFLLALERLTPRQRAVLLLRGVFDYSVKETADALDLSEANVKTTHHRARAAMAAYDGGRQRPTAALQQATHAALLAFMQRLEARDVAGIEALLAEDVKTTTDGGGDYQAALRTIVGRAKVIRFYFAVALLSAEVEGDFVMLNGLPSVAARVPGATGRAAPRFAMTLELDREGKISHIYVVSANRKLTALPHRTPGTIR